MSDDRESDRPAADESPEGTVDSAAGTAQANPPAKSGAVAAAGWLPRLVGPVAAGLIVGLAGGWFGHEVPALAAIGTDPAACTAWREALCEGTGGSESASCVQARSASELLPASTCRDALKHLPATLATLRAARADCTTLVEKLCGDLGTETETCKMVRDKTPAFPVDRCKAMQESYDKVLGQLRDLEARGGPNAAPPGPRRGGRPGGPPHAGGMRPGPPSPAPTAPAASSIPTP
jgi:hypothetical protein